MNIRTLKIWVAAVIILELAGMVILGGVGLYTNSLQSRSEKLMQSCQDEVSRQHQLWDRWDGLDERDKRKMPWGQGKFSGPSKEVQSRILAASLDDLASGDVEVPEQLAVNLYGIDYQLAVRDYKRLRIVLSAMEMASAWAIIAGAGMFVVYFPSRYLLLFLGSVRDWALSVFRRREDKSIDDIFTIDTAEPVSGEVSSAGANSGRQFGRRDGNNVLGTISKSGSKERSEKGMLGCYSSNAYECQDEYEGRSSADSAVDYDFGGDGFKKMLDDKAGGVAVQEKPNEGQQQFSEACVDNTELENARQETSKLLTTEPVNTVESLEELTEQVSAIRDFAAAQQRQVEKFQDGYDWTIIKRFCMRIIRCIDNLELRISRKEASGADVEGLDEVREELLFALESSGVELFEPEPGSEYRGNERLLEAVREREPNNDPERSGLVAAIVRSGYKYVVSDNEEKIVRTAQVRLFE